MINEAKTACRTRTPPSRLSGAALTPVALERPPRRPCVTQPQPSGVLSLIGAGERGSAAGRRQHHALLRAGSGRPVVAHRHAEPARRCRAAQSARASSGVTARSGSFTVYPSTDRDGRISAWRGRTEVVLESHDFAAASKLAGKMSSSCRSATSRSRCRPKRSARPSRSSSAQAIESFREQAQVVGAGVRLQQLFDSRSQRQSQRRRMPRPVMMMQRARDERRREDGRADARSKPARRR